MQTLINDLRYAARQLRKSPGFAIAAILTLALAIGANAVVFSVMNALILRPLNVPRSDGLFGLWRSPDEDMHESYPDYLDLRDRNRSFDGLAAFNMFEGGLDTGKETTDVWVYETSGNYFDTLGLQPYLGRFFHDSDQRGPNSAPYAVLPYASWHSRFQNDPGIIGRTVLLDKHPFTIIGVAPPEFHGTLQFFNPDFFVPIVNHGQMSTDDLNSRKSRWIFMVLGHLKAGVTPAQAAADLDSIGGYLEKTYPKDDGKVHFRLVRPGLYGDFLGRPARSFMTGLMLLSGLILLAACANLGSLFAARAADRSRDVALQLALGSTRWRTVRQFFTEALLISFLGGALGLWGSVFLLHGLSVWQPIPRYPIYMPVNPDVHVYGLAMLLTVASAFLFGVVPIRQVLRTSPYEIVKSGTPSRVGQRITLRDTLLVVQIAICAVLITSSIVAVRGLARSLHNDFGFELKNTMMVDTDVAMAGYTGDRAFPMQKRMLDAVASIPGVESVGLADAVPLSEGAGDSNVFADDTTDLRPANAVTEANMYRVSPEYFRAAGTTVLAGRSFTWHDGKDSPRVAVVNREFARRVFGSAGKAIGGYYKRPDGSRIQVVGIAEDGKYNSLTESPQTAMFLPILQWPSSATTLVVHSERDPQQLATAIRSTLRQLDSGLPAYIQTRLTTMDIIMFGPRMATISLGVLGLMGAMLAITGIFGMAAYSVSKRLKELGIRIALGAQRREVLEAALGHAIKLLAFGSVAGLILGILASRVLAFIVYQATPRDPLVLSGAVLSMALVGLVAAWIPAHRALKINPLLLPREQ
jgi:predicted permease